MLLSLENVASLSENTSLEEVPFRTAVGSGHRIKSDLGIGEAALIDEGADLKKTGIRCL